jgi:hypothetical protein
MAMTRTRYRTQSTLTFLAEQLVGVHREIAQLRKIHRDQDAPADERLRSLDARRRALMEAIQQFDPELDLSAIAGMKEASCEECVAGDAYG